MSVYAFETDAMSEAHMTNLNQMTEPLLAWFDQNKRILPWRENTAPYRVWVSEIMLQQTRVEAVKPYFERFMKALPDLKALADVEEEKLLKLWEGLGYYNRARNLQKAARCVVEEYDGRMPGDYEKLLSLPGIGSYTAGAIASISFQVCRPAVDGNVLRVLSRMTLSGEDILSQKVKKFWEETLRQVMPTERAGDFNQALMELGATVCVPNGAPHCEECPIRDLCKAHMAGRETEFPCKKSKKKRRIEKKTVLIIRDGEKTILHKRAGKGLLAGMYEFPMVDGHVNKDEAVRYLETLGYRVLYIKELEQAKHIFSHVEWHMKGYAVKVEENEFADRVPDQADGHIAVYPEETKDAYPIPAAFRVYARYVDIFSQEKQ